MKLFVYMAGQESNYTSTSFESVHSTEEFVSGPNVSLSFKVSLRCD